LIGIAAVVSGLFAVGSALVAWLVVLSLGVSLVLIASVEVALLVARLLLLVEALAAGLVGVVVTVVRHLK
jgi:hypothetical protein